MIELGRVVSSVMNWPKHRTLGNTTSQDMGMQLKSNLLYNNRLYSVIVLYYDRHYQVKSSKHQIKLYMLLLFRCPYIHFTLTS